MKTLILLFVQIVLFTHLASAQTPVLSKERGYDYFIKKRNTYNTIGWVSLAAGATMIAIGGLEVLGDAAGTSQRYRNDGKLHGSGIAVAGEIVALASIPFFIVAHKFKKKAALSFSKERVYFNKRSYQSFAINCQLTINN